MVDQPQPIAEWGEVPLKCAWRGKRGSIKRHPMHYNDVVATDAEVALVGFRSGGTDKKDGGGGGAGDGAGGGGGGGGGGSSSSQGSAGASGLAIHTITTTAGPGDSSKWYLDPGLTLSTSRPPLAEPTQLSSLSLMTPLGLQQTMLATLGHSDPLPSNVPAMDAPARLPTSPERKVGRVQPKGTLEYKVGKNDTLERIAAHFDVTPSELKKLNRMSSRMVFENQVLYIPDPDYVPSDPPTPEHVSPPHSPVDVRPKIDIPIVKMADKPPARVPGHVMKLPSPPATSKPEVSGAASLPQALNEDAVKDLDEECYDRFIKVCAQCISEGFEKIPGTLLVTPNAIMFDPDLLDDRVLEEGAEHYGVVVYMDTVMSAALYHDLAAIRFQTGCNSGEETSEKPEIYHGDTRGRSASASDILTSKSSSPLPGNVTQAVVSSKSMSGLSPLGALPQQNDDVFSGSEAGSRLSPLPRDGGQVATHGTASLSSVGADTMGVIHIVPSALSVDAQRTLDIGAAPGETSTDDALTSTMTLNKTSDTPNPNLTQVIVTTSQDKPTEALSGTELKTEARPPQRDPSAQTQELDEAEVTSLLAGGRRDSMCADGEAEFGAFYPSGDPTSTEVTDSAKDDDDGQGASDAVIQQCADKLVTEILQSVSLSARQASDCEPVEPRSEHTVKEERTLTETEGERKDGGLVEVATSDTRGEEMRIGNIVYLPVEESSNGEIIVRHTSGLLAEKTEASEPKTGGRRPKPDPLTLLGTDAIDGSSADGTRGRSASESFSPLRSSAQHLSNLVSYATGFFRGSHDDRAGVRETHDIPVVRERSATTSDVEDGKRKKDAASSETKKRGVPECTVTNAVKVEERPELFRQVSDLIPAHEDVHKQPAIYLHLHVDKAECDRRLTTSTPVESYRHQTTKAHYWFSVPRDKADHLYAFFVHWRPEIYGDDDINPEDRGFVVIDSGDVGGQSGSLSFIDDHFGSLASSFKKDWEIVSREELKRRESSAFDLEQNAMPEMSHDSSIMTEQNVLELSASLPPRTIGYKWWLVYSTGLHGFSLKRLYREVAQFDSPILLVLQDTEDVVFGAYLSHPPRLSDHFFGTGECQLWTFRDKLQMFGWSGENALFIKGDDTSLSVGASQGVNGLWLDGDLYHGRSQQCMTFNNAVLGHNEDFTIRALEAWAFLSD